MKLHTEVFKKFPVLKTSRLILREIHLADAAKIYEMRSDGRINEFIARHPMQSYDDAVQLVKRTLRAFQNGNAIGWAATLPEDDKFIGSCGFNHIYYHDHRAELGGELSSEYWGQNYALEAVTAIINFGFEHFGLHSIEAKVSPDNKSATALLEKLGFSKEAQFKDRVFFNGKYSDMAIYSLINKKDE